MGEGFCVTRISVSMFHLRFLWEECHCNRRNEFPCFCFRQHCGLREHLTIRFQHPLYKLHSLFSMYLRNACADCYIHSHIYHFLGIQCHVSISFILLYRTDVRIRFATRKEPSGKMYKLTTPSSFQTWVTTAALDCNGFTM